jgi:hypothetical protein
VIEGYDSDTLGLLAVTGGLGIAMIWLAARMQLLEYRPASRCPACGRLRRRGGGCDCTS